MSQNGRSSKLTATTSKQLYMSYRKIILLFLSRHGALPPPTHRQSFSMVVEPERSSRWVLYPPQTSIDIGLHPFGLHPLGSAFSTSLRLRAEPFAFVAGHLAVVLDEHEVVAIEMPAASCPPTDRRRSH